MAWARTSPVASSTFASRSCTGWPGGGSTLVAGSVPTTTCTTFGRPGMSALPAP